LAKHFIACLVYLIVLNCRLPAQNPHASVGQTIDSLIQRNRALVGQQAFEEAFSVIEVAEQTAKLALGEKSPAYANCLFYHGRTFFNQGKFAEAEPLYLQARDIQNLAIGTEHPDYASTLNGLGNVYRSTGRYEKAGPYYLESLNVRERVLGKAHPLYASSLNNLASLYGALGQYDKAENLYLESKAIREQNFGKDHLEYAASLNNLSNLYQDMGRYAEAESLLLESIEIKKRTLGGEHADYAASVVNLATLYFNRKQYEKAEPLYLESMGIRERVYGQKNAAYLASLGNLADLYYHAGRYGDSEKLQLELVRLRQQMSETRTPEYATALSNLGALYFSVGKYEKAEPLYQESLVIREKELGKEHPEYIQALRQLAELYELQGRYGGSEKFFAEAMALQSARLRRSVSYLSEKELAQYVQLFEVETNRIFNFIRRRTAYREPSGQLNGLGFNNLLFYKGFLLTASAQMNRLASSSEAGRELLLQLRSQRRLLAAEYSKPLPDRDRAALEALEKQSNNTEKKLSALVSGYSQSGDQPGWEAVRAQLKPDEAALEFIRLPCDFPNITDSFLYAALVLRADSPAPQFIPLLEEKQLLRTMAQGNEKTTVGGFSAAYSRGIDPVVIRQTEGLYQLIWQPLDTALAGIKTVYYAPAGLLHRISLEAVPLDSQQRLADRFQLVRMGSTRSLVAPDQPLRQGTEVVLYGGIYYEADTMSHQPGPGSSGSGEAQLSFALADRGSSGAVEAWQYLPGTARELDDIAGVLIKQGFNPRRLDGWEASEESFKSMTNNRPSPRILHLATHGFFFPDPHTSGSGAAGAVQAAFKVSDHPMIRSGLLLAGANDAWKTGKPQQPGLEDGILTAYEISQMDLRNTELVVLSACETGLGDVQGNEGVYGLQRAFKIAGAGYLIMSLWKVPDAQTAQLMSNFYSNWQERHMRIPDAFRAAQKQLRDAGLDPYFWAGFVLLE
jgi:CHAT domain-containing protein